MSLFSDLRSALDFFFFFFFFCLESASYSEVWEVWRVVCILKFFFFFWGGEGIFWSVLMKIAFVQL